MALLQHSTATSPSLCMTILDIFLDALGQMAPLSLNKASFGDQNTRLQILSISHCVQNVSFLCISSLPHIIKCQQPDGGRLANSDRISCEYSNLFCLLRSAVDTKDPREGHTGYCSTFHLFWIYGQLLANYKSSSAI